jgi:hypothetical protein
MKFGNVAETVNALGVALRHGSKGIDRPYEPI